MHYPQVAVAKAEFDIRNEVYLQAMKQLRNNQNFRSELLGWKLLKLFVQHCVFWPGFMFLHSLGTVFQSLTVTYSDLLAFEGFIIQCSHSNVQFTLGLRWVVSHAHYRFDTAEK